MFISSFSEAIFHAKTQLDLYGTEVDAGHWQGYDTKGRPDLVTKELMNLTLEVPVHRSHDDNRQALAYEIVPNLPWADDHFAERVSRKPTNPGEAYKDWPWWQGQVDETQEQGAFTHTYQERFWPKKANHSIYNFADGHENRPGIRYEYGDLDDVIRLLGREPLTRQATFPIFFPEDTGAVHRGRIPCTLHYHFMLRNGMLHMWYAIRSCDYVRHFRDDLYLACRLMLWVLDELRFYHPRSIWEEVIPGHLYFTAYSFHMHAGDAHRD